MHKKAQLSIELGKRVVLFKIDKGEPKVEAILLLEDFSITGSAVKWCMRDNRGHIIEGRVRDEIRLPSHPGSWLTLSVPITIHYFSSVVPNFIFYIPNSRRVLTEYQFRKEFPNTPL